VIGSLAETLSAQGRRDDYDDRNAVDDRNEGWCAGEFHEALPVTWREGAVKKPGSGRGEALGRWVGRRGRAGDREWLPKPSHFRDPWTKIACQCAWQVRFLLPHGADCRCRYFTEFPKFLVSIV